HIDSVPSGADVELLMDDMNVLSSLAGRKTTPLTIDKIRPGEYTLKLRKEGFRIITRRIKVAGERRKTQEIAMEGVRPGALAATPQKINQFVIPFEIPVQIDSLPSGADLLLNGEKLAYLVTPTNLYLTLGKTYCIKLRKEGFETLGSDIAETKEGSCCLELSADMAEGQKTMDKRYWTLNKKTESGIDTYALQGLFFKKIRVISIPAGAEMYLDKEEYPRASTPVENLPVVAGTHKIRLVKQGYEEWGDSFEIAADKQVNLEVRMNKKIRFAAYNKDDPQKREIEAVFSIQGTKHKIMKTPVTLSMPVGYYTVTFSKPPRYKNRAVSIDIAKVSEIAASMELERPHLKVTVRDQKTKKSIPDATVWLNKKYWNKTNSQGEARDYTDQGTYEIEVKSGDKYQPWKESRQLVPGEKADVAAHLEMVFGSLIIDVSEILPDGDIYFDNVLKGKGVVKVSVASLGKHTVRIESLQLVESLTYEVEIRSQKLVMVKLEIKKGRPQFIVID
ncbi:MAG TPA: PEGA domain-containing protein, partial [bacterium]|nr:PEGA domain-containing protein [bacterium]